MVSARDEQGKAEIYVIDLSTYRVTAVNKGIGQNSNPAGLHRAQFKDMFAWADYKGGVYRVPIKPVDVQPTRFAVKPIAPSATGSLSGGRR